MSRNPEHFKFDAGYPQSEKDRLRKHREKVAEDTAHVILWFMRVVYRIVLLLAALTILTRGAGQ